LSLKVTNVRILHDFAARVFKAKPRLTRRSSRG
jgi:hypothetical protein